MHILMPFRDDFLMRSLYYFRLFTLSTHYQASEEYLKRHIPSYILQSENIFLATMVTFHRLRRYISSHIAHRHSEFYRFSSFPHISKAAALPAHRWDVLFIMNTLIFKYYCFSRFYIISDFTLIPLSFRQLLRLGRHVGCLKQQHSRALKYFSSHSHYFSITRFAFAKRGFAVGFSIMREAKVFRFHRLFYFSHSSIY